MITNYNILKKKDVVNVLNGKNLGKIVDLVIDTQCGKILKIIVTGKKNGLFFCDEMEISYNKITKIGDDAILVKLCDEKPVIQNNQNEEELEE